MVFSRPDSEAVMQLSSSNVTLMVGDMDRSIAFYESIGLKLKQRWNNHYAMLEGPGITLGPALVFGYLAAMRLADRRAVPPPRPGTEARRPPLRVHQ